MALIAPFYTATCEALRNLCVDGESPPVRLFPIWLPAGGAQTKTLFLSDTMDGGCIDLYMSVISWKESLPGSNMFAPYGRVFHMLDPVEPNADKLLMGFNKMATGSSYSPGVAFEAEAHQLPVDSVLNADNIDQLLVNLESGINQSTNHRSDPQFMMQLGIEYGARAMTRAELGLEASAVMEILDAYI